MKRVAKIKFSENSKLYDYICEDISINEGDVVYVEGKDFPLYVYEIVEINDSDCKADKSVIKKAKENPNVLLESRYMSITKCECECIVNSLGPKTNIFGAICNSIVNEAKSNEIDSMLSEHPTANIFDIFVTDAGTLPSKHIIHIVMPFKKEDKFNENLKQAFRLVIDKAIELGYESIGIPFIGTGANGYTKEDISNALNRILFEYQFKEDIKIRIVSIVYNTAGRYSLLQGREREIYLEREILSNYRPKPTPDYLMTMDGGPICGNSKASSSSYYYDDKKTHILLDALNDYYDPEEEFELPKDVKVDNPVDYIRQFKKKKKLTYISSDYQAALSYSDQSKVSSGERQIKKYEVINLAIACRMNFTEFVQLMLFSGFSLSTNSVEDVDLFILNYLIKYKHFKGLALTYDSIGEAVSPKALADVYNPK